MERRVVVVTGANRGLGLELVRQLARRGWTAVLTARSPDRGEARAAELRDQGLDVRFHPLDVTREDQAAALDAWLWEETGRLDALVNNAGISVDGEAGDSSVLAVPVETIARTLDTNTLGPLRVTRALAPLLRESPHGRVVNVSSGMGQLADMAGRWPGYRLSKAALNALTRVLAAELADDGVRVWSVCPGWVRTDLGGERAPRSPEKGVETMVWLLEREEPLPTGGFYRDMHQIPW